MRKLLIFIMLLFIFNLHSQVLVETESFKEKGGWVVDPQFMDQMGSPYLMAHGLGHPVKNAKTTVIFPNKGLFKVWVRTYNWVSPWYNTDEGPGAFKISVNGKTLPTILGTKGDAWMWQEAGIIDLSNTKKAYRHYGTRADIELIDLAGFNGRVDAILFTKDMDYIPPTKLSKIQELRNQLLRKEIKESGHYDLVVIGGGMAGCTAALTASRLGLKVALINDRPVLGGNNSSEIRVGLSGSLNKNYYPKIGNVLRELTGIPIPEDSHMEPGKLHPPKREASKEMDKLRETILKSESTVSLFLNTHVTEVQMQDNAIVSVVGEDVETGQKYRFAGTYFSDCTGDGTVGYLAGADYREGRESYYEDFEPLAPLIGDKHTLGTSLLWTSTEEKSMSEFPLLPWAVQCLDEYHLEGYNGRWTWESGFKKDIVIDAEHIRDNLLRAIYGNWSYLKTNKENYKKRTLNWVPYIGGKRESRRLLGDIVLTENDIMHQVDYLDKSYTTTWFIDVHYEEEENSRFFPGEEWQAYAKQIELPAPYHVPYRTLYSRNIKNLFMAGRCVSVSHIALGTVRVMVTTGMMGEVVGMAAKICKDHNDYPRDVYEKHLLELQHIMATGVTKIN